MAKRADVLKREAGRLHPRGWAAPGTNKGVSIDDPDQAVAGRSAWRLGRTRQQRLALTFKAAAEDEEFRNLTAEADAARDAGRWEAAERAYGRALGIYPLHFGYRIQHAHMCKEQGRFDEAEIGYRDALTLGASTADVAAHLAFVADRQGHSGAPPVVAAAVSGPMGETPCVADIEALGYILWREAHLSHHDVLDLLRACATCDAVAARMIADERFPQRNGPFLALMASRR
jgi:tetratricopeptide (TPR) repeat protein